MRGLVHRKGQLAAREGKGPPCSSPCPASPTRARWPRPCPPVERAHGRPGGRPVARRRHPCHRGAHCGRAPARRRADDHALARPCFPAGPLRAAVSLWRARFARLCTACATQLRCDDDTLLPQAGILASHWQARRARVHRRLGCWRRKPMRVTGGWMLPRTARRLRSTSAPVSSGMRCGARGAR